VRNLGNFLVFVSTLNVRYFHRICFLSLNSDIAALERRLLCSLAMTCSCYGSLAVLFDRLGMGDLRYLGNVETDELARRSI